MMHFKSHNKAGFTLIEVLIAVLIVGLVIVPLISSVTSIFTRLATFSNRTQAIMLMNNYLQEMHLNATYDAPPGRKEKEFVVPMSVKLSYEYQPAADHPVLKKFKTIYRERVSAVWQEGNKQIKEVMINFVYRSAASKEVA